jgi:putative aldouronate transport system permease protein
MMPNKDSSQILRQKKKRIPWKIEAPLHIMMLPSIIFLAIFCYFPMYGNVMAFQNFNPGRGFLYSPFAGLKHFRTLFALPNIMNVFYNTVFIASAKIIFGTIAAIILSLMLNEVRSSLYRRGVQTIIYMPYFLSWVILGSIFTTMFSNDGFVNQIIASAGGEKVFFLGDNNWFRFIIILTDVWKGAGFGTVVYLAAITGIDPTLYEAAVMDGAGRMRQIWHVTLPGMLSIIVLMAMLNLGNLLNAGFDQIFNMYNPLVMESADIIDTLVYRLGMVSAKFSLATAVGLLKSVVSMILISLSYFLAYKVANYHVF